MKFSSGSQIRVPLLSAALAALLAIDSGAFLAPPHGPKPMFPVLARLELVSSPAPGGVVTVLASIQAWAPEEEVLWSLSLPSGVERVSGNEAFRGRLDRGEVRTFALTLRIPDGEPYEITASARLPERPRATSAATLRIDLGVPSGPGAAGQVVAGDGATHIQYPGEVTPREGGR
jgi:hypothetical protein